ncbi:hypothetical protein C8Q73DRAFT_160061 [Cubamyces lactineus]|nr:hypothetical protein C8Q73DRAFT_160061 [Cubamyces lactineus]
MRVSAFLIRSSTAVETATLACTPSQSCSHLASRHRPQSRHHTQGSIISSAYVRYLGSEDIWARHVSSCGGSQYVGASSCGGIAGEAPLFKVWLYLGLGGFVQTPISCGFWA